MASRPKPPFSAKRLLFVGLENVLIPGKAVSNVDVSQSRAFLKQLRAYATKHHLFFYIISGYPDTVSRQKVVQFGLEKLIPLTQLFGVDASFLEQLDPVDRERYAQRLATDPEATDEYFRQVKMQALLHAHRLDPREALLVGHDYWFDGFYTRRYAGVDIVFIQASLTNRGEAIEEKMEGVWHAPLSWKAVQSFLTGKKGKPNYGPLDAWIQTTLTEALLGGKGVSAIRRVIIQRKKNKTGGDIVKID